MGKLASVTMREVFSLDLEAELPHSFVCLAASALIPILFISFQYHFYVKTIMALAKLVNSIFLT